MTDITIPPEALETATLAIFRTRYSFDPIFPQDDHQWELCRAYATAALRAGINAWPRSYSLAENDSAVIRDVAAIILPLPQEPTND